MKYKFLLLAVAFVFLAAGCGAKTEPTTDNSSNDSAQQNNQSEQAKTYTMAEVSQANAQTNCWAIVDGSVYNLTEWIAKHPGGSAAILSLCGKDGTAQFSKQHGSNEKAKAALARYKIGDLAK